MSTRQYACLLNTWATGIDLQLQEYVAHSLRRPIALISYKATGKENLAAIRVALKDDQDATVVEMPGLNHMFLTAKNGAVGEYATIEETVAPAALTEMASWINARLPPR